MATTVKATIALALRADAAATGSAAPPPPPPPPRLTGEGGVVAAVNAAGALPPQPPPKPDDDPAGFALLSAAARFYARALAPTAVLVLWMFTIYAALAYVVPHVLCVDTVSSQPVREEGKKGRGTYPSLHFGRPLQP